MSGFVGDVLPGEHVTVSGVWVSGRNNTWQVSTTIALAHKAFLDQNRRSDPSLPEIDVTELGVRVKPLHESVADPWAFQQGLLSRLDLTVSMLNLDRSAIT